MTEFSVCFLAHNGRNMHVADASNLIFPAQVVCNFDKGQEFKINGYD